MPLAHRLALVAAFTVATAACAQQPSRPAGAPGDSARPAAARADSAGPFAAWHPDVAAALAAAATSKKPVLVYVYAAWCPWCRRLDREVYPTGGVSGAVAQYFEPVRVDGEDTTRNLRFGGLTLSNAQFAAALGAQGYPFTAFLTPDGALLTKLPGFSPADQFGRVLRYVGTRAYETKPFDAFEPPPAGSGNGG